MSFFSEAEHKFQVIAKGQPTPTEPFLKACAEIFPFIGKLKYTIVLLLINNHMHAQLWTVHAMQK